MVLSQYGESVTVVNRVVDSAGKPVPYDAHVDGDVITIVDSVSLPSGIARIIVQGSMYCLDPETRQGQYKLGIKEWGVTAPIDPVSQEEIRDRLELIERTKLPPDRQYGWTTTDGKKFAAVRTKIALSPRSDPIAMNVPGPRQDGAHPGGFGDAFTKA